MTIFIDADESLTTWRLIAESGHYQSYRGRANSGDVILRWGCNHGRYSGRYPVNDGVRVLNQRIVLSKIEQGMLMEEGGVSIPKIFRARLSWERAGRPRLVRKRDIGQMGTGMILVDSPSFPDPTHVYQLYIDKQREFRAMMVGPIMAFFMEKHPPATGDFRWNEHRGATWTSVPPDDRLRRNIKALGHKALQAIGYDFGAVDIIQDNTGKLYVLEVNSRPEFGAGNAERFTRAVAAYLTLPRGD